LFTLVGEEHQLISVIVQTTSLVSC